jgi:predicted lactoylglutathione lyase
MTAQRITMVTLTVADLAVSRTYYRRLGWIEVKGGNETIAFYKLRGFFLSLYCQNAIREDIGRQIPSGTTGVITLVTNYGSSQEVDAAYSAAILAGGNPITRPEKVFWGGYSGTVADPDGHLWEYAHNPFWALDADGYLEGDA